MLRAYLLGARAAAQRWPLIVVLGVITALFGVAFALASGAWLDDALEGSLATRTLLHRIDADVLVDLWYHHREGLNMLLVAAALLAVVHTALWWWLHGVVIAALQWSPQEHGSIWARGFELAPVMARLFVLALCALALFSAAVGGSAYALMRWTRSSPQALVWEQIAAGAVVVWIVGYVFSSQYTTMLVCARRAAAPARCRRTAGRSPSSSAAANAPTASPVRCSSARSFCGSPTKRSG
jgi:hypothetical protein